MSNSRISSDPGRGALESIPSAWRTIYVAVFIVLCIAFGALAAAEYDDLGRWTATPFTTLTQVVIGTGTASGLLSLFITEIARAIVLPCVWLEKKLNENLRKGRERLRKEALAEGRAAGRAEAIEYGRTVALLESQGKQPPPPPWEKAEDDQSS